MMGLRFDKKKIISYATLASCSMPKRDLNLKVRNKVRAGAASDGPKAVEKVEADLELASALFNKEEWTMEERFTIPPPMQLNSMVVKLNSGAILLFAPVRVRDEVIQLIDPSQRNTKTRCSSRSRPQMHLLLYPGWLRSLA